MDISKITGIGEKTNVSIGLVVVLVAGVSWLSSAVGETSYLKDRMGMMRDRILRVETKQDEYNATVNKIDGKLTEIEKYIRHGKAPADE